MGYMRHHAIIVTSWQPEHLKQAYEKAQWLFKTHELFDGNNLQVQPISPPLVNGYASFLIAPDGSNEGWEESEHGDKARAEFVNWLKTHIGELWLDWVEVVYGGDDPQLASLLNHSGRE